MKTKIQTSYLRKKNHWAMEIFGISENLLRLLILWQIEYKYYTVEPLLTHTSRWMAQAMGYGLQGVNFGVNFGFVAAKKYGL
jgi:hypothetical protein